MTRKADGAWFRTSKNAWYATIEGKAIALGIKGRESRAEATRAWHLLMAGMSLPSDARAEAKAVKKAKGEDLTALVLGFLASCEGRVGETTLRNYRLYLTQFAEAFAGMPVSARAVERWVKRPSWCETTQHDIIGMTTTLFRWAVESGKMEKSPIAGIRRPHQASRGHNAVFTRETHNRLVEVASGDWQDFLRLLWETGTRPGEISGLTAEEVAPALDDKVLVLGKHKTMKKTGRERLITLTEEAVGILRRLVARHPSGLLFPNRKGKRFTPNALAGRIRTLCRRAGVKVIAYGYRHTFATDALARGVPDAQVSALLGHSNTAMLHKHYAHLPARSQVLREAVGKVR